MFLFGTNGFLVFHALLLALDLFVTYTSCRPAAARRSRPRAYAAVFLLASVVPVYFVWLTPELFNFSLALYALFLWSYKEIAVDAVAGARTVPARPRIRLPGRGAGRRPDLLEADARAPHVSRWSRSPRPAPVAARSPASSWSGRWSPGGLFAINAAITGEFNYQGGDRKTFYSSIGFPFANERETFENIGPARAARSGAAGRHPRDRHTQTVFRHNLGYFLVGRSSGLLPYFFPGVVSVLLFLAVGAPSARGSGYIAGDDRRRGGDAVAC